MHPLVAAVLVAAGVTDPGQAKAYLSGSLDSLPDPLALRGMGEAVELVLGALAAGEEILVHGDYDADGICAAAVLLRTLSRLGGLVHFYIPDRLADGYGVSERAVRAAARRKIPLLVTVDCGITAHEEIALAKSLGCRVIVLDHHEPDPDLPEADVVVAPRLPDWEYTCAEMPAAALALRFVQALGNRVGDDTLWAKDLVELAAVGIVADVAPMEGENRIIVRAGLDRLPHSPLPGLRALQELAAVKAPVRAYDVGFRIAPRINAVGRLADAGDALELLLTDDDDKARRLALYLDGKNRERQQIQQQIYNQAVRMLGAHPELLEMPVLVLHSDTWHVGVVGIVASKIAEDFGRPAVLLGSADGLACGSARSVAGFDITAALRSCGHLLIRCGGHSMAAGLTAEVSKIEDLRRALEAYCELVGTGEALAEVPGRVAIPVMSEELDETIADDLARLEPFGPGNPEPLFALCGLEVVEARTVGRDNSHLKLVLTDGARALAAIGFRMGNGDKPKPGDHIDVCFVPETDNYWGKPQLQLRLVAWEHSGTRGRH